MTIDWKALKPHLALGPGDALYVPRVGMGAREIAGRVAGGDSRILLAGPPGNGKSTELAQIPSHARVALLAVFASIGRTEDMRKLSAERLSLRLAEAVQPMPVGHRSRRLSRLGTTTASSFKRVTSRPRACFATRSTRSPESSEAAAFCS